MCSNTHNSCFVFCFLLQLYSIWDHKSYVIFLYWIFCIFWWFFQIFKISQTWVWKSILQISHVWLDLTSWFIDDQRSHDFSPYFKHFFGFFIWRNFIFRVEFPKKENDYIISGSINCVAWVGGFLYVVVWQCLVVISLRYSPIDLQGQISNKGNQNRKLVHFSLAFLGNVCSLLVVMNRKKLQYLP